MSTMDHKTTDHGPRTWETNGQPQCSPEGLGPPFKPNGMNFECRECGQPIQSARAQKKQVRFCSDECRGKFWRKQKGSGALGVSSQTVAEIHRLLAAADLMKRGYQVFRALSPDYDCAFVVSVAGQWRLVGVRVGYAGEGGAVPLNKPPEGAFDLLAIVTSLGVFYQPPLEELHA